VILKILLFHCVNVHCTYFTVFVQYLLCTTFGNEFHFFLRDWRPLYWNILIIFLGKLVAAVVPRICSFDSLLDKIINKKFWIKYFLTVHCNVLHLTGFSTADTRININKNAFFQIIKPAFYWKLLALVTLHLPLKIRNGIKCRERNSDHRHTMKQMRRTASNTGLFDSVNQAKENNRQFVAQYRNQNLQFSQNILIHV
jgi:hypothetical protein